MATDQTIHDDDVSVGWLVNGEPPTNNYADNSSYQRLAANVAKDMIEEAITKNLDLKSILSISATTTTTIHLADLGCAVGPNTLSSIQEKIEVIKKIFQTQFPTTSSSPQFLVSFNDLPTNDFNTLFLSLLAAKPDYFACGVPGSFYVRLFPNSSLHYAQVSYALHWMSRVPHEVQEKGSRAWNKRRIHYTNAPEEVREAYAKQWGKDMDDFLNARGEEIVSGGILVAVTHSAPDGMAYSELANGIMIDCMANILLDIAQEGLVKEEEIDAFNLAIYAASPGEFVSVVEKNGYFKIVAMECTDPSSLLSSPSVDGEVHIDMPEFVRHIRAAMTGMFLQHFATEVVDRMFELLEVKLSTVSEQMELTSKAKVQATYVLQRKQLN